MKPDTWIVRFDLDPFGGKREYPANKRGQLDFFFDDPQIANTFLEFFSSNQFVNLTDENGKTQSYYLRNVRVEPTKARIYPGDVEEI